MSWSWTTPLRHLPKSHLIVRPDGWSVSAYWPPYDRRRSGTHWGLTATEVPLFASALEAAWEQFTLAKERADNLGSLQTGGQMNIQINGRMNILVLLGGYTSGITIHYHHGLLRSAQEVEQATAELRALPTLAARVQAAFANT